MKIFISYRRKTIDFVERLRDGLQKRLHADVFVDIHSIDDDDFETSILVHLQRCDVFVLVVSEHTFDPKRIYQDEDWVRREIAVALNLGKPIVLALYNGTVPPPTSDLPEDIRKITGKQGIEFYPKYFNAGVVELAEFIETIAPKSVRPIWYWIAGVVALIAVIGVGVAAEGVFGGAAPTATVPTIEPIGTSVLTLRAVEAARARAEAGVMANADWTPYVEEFSGVEMALVPVGCFMMGSDNGSDDEKPVHKVCFDTPFWIDVTEVTNKQYGSSGNWSGDDFPREKVDWEQAKRHCGGRGARLPSEAEWEYAARGPNGLVFSWGDTFVEGNVIYQENSDGRTAVVNTSPGGMAWVGALNMNGNVWEWANDWYQDIYYSTLLKEISNPAGPGDGEYRVVRGGSWNSNDFSLRSTYRYGFDPINKSDSVGFRCARDY